MLESIASHILRHELVRIALALNAPQPATGKVKADQPHTLLRQHVEKADARVGRGLGVLIRTAGPFRPLKRYVTIAYGIADYQNCALGAAKLEGHMPRRMTEAAMGDDAGTDLLAALERAHVFRDGFKPAGRAHGKAGPCFPDCLYGFRVGPIGVFAAPHHILCLGKDRIVEVVEHPPKVIGMPMGKDNLRDVLGPDPHHTQSIDKLTGGRHESRARATIKEDG